MAKLNDLNLDSDAPIDDRWTLDKLRRAGWQEEWSRSCRSCGEMITAYRKGLGTRLLVLDEATLEEHRC